MMIIIIVVMTPTAVEIIIGVAPRVARDSQVVDVGGGLTGQRGRLHRKAPELLSDQFVRRRGVLGREHHRERQDDNG